MNILVTGATGFVGTALLKRVCRENCHVRAAVLFGERIDHLPAKVEMVIVQPLSDTADYADALRGIDVVVHLAARVHVMDEDAVDPLVEFRRVNVAGTERLTRQAVAHGVRRLVFLSSVKVHGEESDVPYSEENHLAPQDPYGVSKLEAENILHLIAAETGLEVIIIRPTLVYGPGVKANFLRLLRMVERGVPLPLASITNARSLVYLGNLIDAIITCVNHPQAAGQTYLVSDGEDVSTPKLICQIATALDLPDRLIPLPPSILRLAGKLTGKSMAVNRLLGSLVVDSGKIRRELGWKPPFTMAEGLAETAIWFRKKS